MDTLTAIKTRRAVRVFTDKKVSDDILHKILDAGRIAPSPLNSQAWHFIVIKKIETIKQLAKYAKHGSFLSTANIVIVVNVDVQAKVDDWLAKHNQHIYSGVCAMQNMWLAAWDLGIGCCWVTLDDKKTRNTLSIPSSQILLGSLSLGFMKESPKLHTENDRNSLSTMVSYEKFGQK